MQEKAHDFPNAVEAFFLVLALFLAEYVVGRLLSDMHTLLDISAIEFGVLVTVLGNGVVFTVVMQIKHLSYRKLFHAASTPPPQMFSSLLVPILLLVPALVLAMSTVSVVLSSWFPLSSAQEAMFDEMASNGLPMLIASCILAPVLEEMLFRGVILRSFLHQYPRWPAILGSALLFGFAHMNIYQFVIAGMLGVILGWLYERTQSLLPCMTLHAAYNSALSLASVSEIDAVEGDASVILWIVAALLAAFGVQYLQQAVKDLKT